MSLTDAPPRLEVIGAVKRFGAFAALDGVDLRVQRGSVHALLGHNGAGKSTLIGLIGGAVAPTAGSILVDGTEQRFTNPRDSTAAGIAVIHQHLSLVDSLPVGDNIFLGEERSRAGFVNRRTQHAIAATLLERVGASCATTDLVGTLPTAQRQLVEIAKALRHDSKILVLDEPTASLSDVESKRLGALIGRLRGDGLAIVYVTHLLQEVELLADEVTVLQDGHVVHSSSAAELDRAGLVQLIAGGTAPAEQVRDDRGPVAFGAPVLTAEQVEGPGFGPVDLVVRRGEVVGLFGMLGSGRGELLATLAGARRPTGGRILLAGRVTRFASPCAAARQGVSHVADDRVRDGLLHGLGIADNVVVSSMRRLGRFGWRDRGAERTLLLDAKRAFSITAPDGVRIGSLSGGNQQKVMLARAAVASARPRVLLLDGPSQGVDVGSRADIARSLRAMADAHGTAIVFSSSDPEEVLALADRALVFRQGVVVAELPTASATDTELVHLASHGADTAPDPFEQEAADR